MRKYKSFIYLLLFSIFFQNGIILFDLIEDYLDIDTNISLLVEKSEDCKSQEDNEDNEKESKENEIKEKELKNYYKEYSSVINAKEALKYASYFNVSKIFKQYFETEIPPPKFQA